MSQGKLFRAAIASHKPLPIPGVINSLAAKQATKIGFQALYLSGAGVANATYGIPDIGLTTLENVVDEISKITAVTNLPLLVDADTGWGGVNEVANAVRQIESANAAGLHLEDQIIDKKCGHLDGKTVIPTSEMVAKLTAAVTAKQDKDFFIMARTDSLAINGIADAISRAKAYQDAGADAIFFEAVTELGQITALKHAISIPVLINMTEFGKTPAWSRDELLEAKADILLYPLSAMRAMYKASENVYKAILHDGTQKGVLDVMQTREELYRLLDYDG